MPDPRLRKERKNTLDVGEASPYLCGETMEMLGLELTCSGWPRSNAAIAAAKPWPRILYPAAV